MKHFQRIKKKIRRSKLKQAVELYYEMFLIFLVILLFGLCLYFIYMFDTGENNPPDYRYEMRRPHPLTPSPNGEGEYDEAIWRMEW